MNSRIEGLKGKLIVSCQALPEEPLHSSFIMYSIFVCLSGAESRYLFNLHLIFSKSQNKRKN